MAQDEVVQAIDGAVLEIEGQRRKLTGTNVEPIGSAGQYWAVRFTIAVHVSARASPTPV